MGQEAPRSLSPQGSHGLAFWIAVASGLGIAAVGVVTLARTPPDFSINVSAWVIGADVAHDALVAPVAAAFAYFVLRRVPEPFRAPLGAAIAWTAIVLVVSIPLLGAFGRSPKRPSVLPLDYGTAIPTALVIGYALSGVWLCARVVAARRRP